MQLDQYQIVVIGPNGPEFWPVSQLQVIAPTKPDPAKVTDPVPAKKPVAGEPRTLLGNRGDHPIYVCTINGVKMLIELVSGYPDAFVPRGFNVDYTPFVAKVIGPESSNYGNDPLPDFTRPEGYRKRYFPGDKRLYWEQSDLPDEEDPTVTIPATSAPATSVNAPAQVQTSVDLGGTAIRKMNSDVFDPLVSWKDGLARVDNKVSLTPGPGENYYVSETGQPPTIGFPPGYYYKPGTEVSILVYLSTSPDLVPLDGKKKGYATLYIGNPPKTA